MDWTRTFDDVLQVLEEYRSMRIKTEIFSEQSIRCIGSS